MKLEMHVNQKELKKFGWIMMVAFSVIGLYPLWKATGPIRIWAIVIGVLFGLAGSLFPKKLEPLFRMWMRIGHILGWINSRLILALLFYGMIAPIGWIMGMRGKIRSRKLWIL